MQEKDETILKSGNWLPKNRERLEKLIKEKAFQNNYVVFDWDFTCVFYDTQDNIFAYQVENLLFNLSPEEFSVMIRAGIPQDIPFKSSPSIEGRELTAGDLAKDLDERYAFLYKNYEAFEGSMPLEKIICTEEYIDFKAKIFALASHCYAIGGPDLCQSVSTGFSVAELEKVAEASIDTGLNDEIEFFSIQSSSKLKGHAGMVQASYRKGLRIHAEVQDLFAKLQENGIKVYICTASQTDPVRVFGTNPKYGYNVEEVFGRRRILVNDRISNDYDESIPATHGPGKAETIAQLIAPRHEGKAPILIAGDSDGDFYMMDKYKDEAVIMLLDREKAPKKKISAFIEEAKKSVSNESPKFLFQPRDESLGYFSANYSK